MKAPDLADKLVKGAAYLTDEHFGYDHWQFRQFCGPDVSKPALLILFDSKEERDAAFTRYNMKLAAAEAGLLP